MTDFLKRVEMSTLLDIYRPLLTDHRAEIVRLYCDEDLSTLEIAQQLGITRQGVSDALAKAESQLKSFEQKLGLANRSRTLVRVAETGIAAIETARKRAGALPELEAALNALNEIIQMQEASNGL